MCGTLQEILFSALSKARCNTLRMTRCCTSCEQDAAHYMQRLLPQIKISGFFLQKWQVKRVVNRSTAIFIGAPSWRASEWCFRYRNLAFRDTFSIPGPLLRSRLKSNLFIFCFRGFNHFFENPALQASLLLSKTGFK